MAAAATKRGMLAEDVPWRALPTGQKPLPRIHHNPLLRLSANPTYDYALAVMKRPDPIGDGFAMEARVEAAGPDCLVPGQVAPVKILGVKVWPINFDLKFLEPVGRELKLIGKAHQQQPVQFPFGRGPNPDYHLRSIKKKFGEKQSQFLDSAVKLMNASFQDR